MILVLNLKMNLNKNSVIEYENFIKDKNVIVLPQYPYLVFFSRGNYLLGSQDVSRYAKGSFTGEVCAKGLRGLGVKYVLVGHYERKKYFNESSNDFHLKMQNIIENEMIPIFCVNQTIEEKEQDVEFKKIEEQLEAIPQNVKYILVAYEPVWSIGEDNNFIDIDHIEKVIAKIREYLMERNINASIIYGGGITPENIVELKKIKGNDGFIVSSSALEREKLETIYSELKN